MNGWFWILSDTKRRRSVRRPIPVAWLGVLLLLLPVACDNSFNPIAEEKTDFFGLFGYLNTMVDTQFVRVSPLREMLASSIDGRTIQASLRCVETGGVVAWQDSLVQLDDGTTGLLFYTSFPVEPGVLYQLEVQEDEEEVTRAVTQIPPRIRLEAEPVAPDGADRLIQRITLLDQAQLPHALRRRYEVLLPENKVLRTFVFSYLSPGQTRPQGLEIVLPLEADREEILRRLEMPNTTALVLQSVGIEVEQLSTEWEHPDTPVNIENGFGFFGSIAHYVIPWPLDEADIVRLGYQAPE